VKKSHARTILVAATLGAAVCVLSFAHLGTSGKPIRVGVNHSPPYSTIDADGKPRGFSVELITEAARRRGMAIQWVVANEGPDAALASGRVDIFPLVTDTPSRRGHIFFSEPYLRTRFSLLVPGHSAIRAVGDAATSRIAHASLGLTGPLALQFFPRATLIATPPGDEMLSVCLGTSDAAFLEHKALLRSLLARPDECRSLDFEFLPIKDASFDMGIGSNAAGRDAATALRAEITNLSRDGTLNELFAKWLHDTGDETRIVTELSDANERTRLLFWGVALLGVTLILLIVMMHRKRLAEKAIKSAYDFASVALDSAGGLVLICDRKGNILRFNRACERTSGLALSDVRGKPTWELLVPEAEKGSVRNMFEQLGSGTGHSNHEHHWTTEEGLRLLSWSNTTLTNQNGRVDYIIATGIDITAREEAEERLGYEATHDPLTSLANRRHFMRELDLAEHASRQGAPAFHLAIADLDKFKLINDTFGHAAGDEVLVFFARAVREELAPEDLGGRLGGDEFSLLLRSPFARNRIERIGKKLREQVFRAPNGETFRAGATFGLTAWSDSTHNSAELLALADDALYRAKRERCLPLPPHPSDPAGTKASEQETGHLHVV
jgi:diguanylate cyclase (GGDEF)-like protein/PAS domain S-box-containing protein